MPHSRRSFLATLGAAAVGALLPARSAARSLDRVGLQLYTVRNAMRDDVARTLERVAAIGYREVEFAGYFGVAPARIATLLRENGLSSPSTHVGLEPVRDDWSRVADEASAAGHTWITVPWLPADARRTLDDWKRTAELFNERAAMARAAGLRFAYHNHDFEFATVDGLVPFDLLLDVTDPEHVEFELDIYWMTKAGFDPLDYFARHPRRFVMTHLKDSAGPPDHRMSDVGSGTIDFRRIIAAASAAGVQHHFVEHDQPADAMASVQASYAYLAALKQ